MKSLLCVLLSASSALYAVDPIDFEVKLETVMKHDDGKFLWFHPRVAPVPGGVVMTIQKHLKVSDYYSGLHFMRREGVDGAWSGPILPPEIDWQPQPDGVTLSVADVTPGWHEKTGKLLAIGCRVRYSPKGKQLDDVKRAHQTVYAVFDPKSSKWTPWQILELPEGEEFNFARNACSQWVVKNDGKLLVPLYIGKSAKDRFSTTVAECSFDGEKLVFERNSNVLRLDVARGLYEPSLITLGDRYYLTLRNDLGGYVSSSDDGLHFAEPKPWTFDDGAELGSYNTQQHWLSHGDGLFLVYTRRGANNDHIVRNRAPLFMARVDPEKLQIIRASEKVIVPERGAELGNFGCVRISDDESWVTVSEGMFMKDSAKRGAEGATFVARILWSKPQAEPDWKLEGTAAWQARDSQAEWVFKDRLWIGGGWFQSYADPPRDVWSSGDGKAWDLIEKNAPWQHSDLPMNIAFADKLWIMGGWYKGRLPGHSASHQVWSSGDGVNWEQVTANAGWSPRLAAGLVEHRGRMWMLGGTEDYYFGNESNLKNDVWSSADGKAWKLETANAAWSPRAYHQAVVLNDKIYVLGGGNYVPSYHAKNDVWSSSDGVNWTCETESAPWGPRLWFSAAVYRGRIWVVGGWSKEKDNFGDVWHSADGKNWQRLETKTGWKARHEHSLFVFRDKLWLAGGHARPLSSEVWSLALPTDWRPTITLPLRIHLVQSDSAPAMQTTLLEEDVKRILGKVNTIWSQAGIQFETESVTPTRAVSLPPEMRLKSEFDRIHSMIPKESLSSNAIDVCYVKQMQPNGYFSGEPIVVKDTAKLREVPGGLDEPLPRVTSHEIGHSLGLSHRQQNTNLMQSGTTGFGLSETEIQTARIKAAEILARFQTKNTGTVSKPSLSQ